MYLNNSVISIPSALNMWNASAKSNTATIIPDANISAMTMAGYPSCMLLRNSTPNTYATIPNRRL